MASVTYEHVYKRYPGNVVITDMNAEVKDKEFVVLVGPSGSGKSTALRMLAGLEEISDGKVLIGDRVVNDIPPKDRDIAMVFQSYALYPHMTVYDNLSFGLKLRKTPKAEIDKRVREAARILGLDQLLSRKPKALSGGQRQRVALGRAIVRKPKVFLMDEPLSNLDAKLRVQTRVEILKLHQDLQTTFIYVTHDQVEAMTMGDRIVVLNYGVVQQFDSPTTLYNHPVNLFVAGFIGSPAMNFLTVKVGGDGQAALTTDGVNVPVPERLLSEAGAERGQEVIMGIRPEDLKDSRFPGRDDLPKVAAKVDVVENMGSENFVYFTLAGKPFVSRMDPRSSDIQPGQQIQVALDTGHIHLFDSKTEKALVSRGKPADQVPAVVAAPAPAAR
ncbi:MAG TPA: sn-glycerol-3-phosphate ABC transporter ATP-binding protein UgpC [Candidatus Dormibacteraeota bacterium]|nr:sn-glycerol-3-phosphate ABC transporter ATP-binding protein UgpC [Candidatus Dormibacteraeota bacterium]